MWKYALTIVLACLTVAGSAAAADRARQAPGGGWQIAEHRSWHRDDDPNARQDGGRDRRRGESRQPRRERNGDWRGNRNQNRNWNRESVQDDYRQPFARPPAQDRRYNRDQRDNRNWRDQRDNRNWRDQRDNRNWRDQRDNRNWRDQRDNRNWGDPRNNRDRRYNPDQGGRGRARDAYKRGKIVSLDQVMNVVQRRYGGRVLNVSLDDRNLVYHLRVLTRRGRVMRISVDARNARILSATGGRR
jgi:uncharacterized membrane protein YkoI